MRNDVVTHLRDDNGDQLCDLDGPVVEAHALLQVQARPSGVRPRRHAQDTPPPPQLPAWKGGRQCLTPN